MPGLGRPVDTGPDLAEPTFAGNDGHADVAVVVVTYDSARDVDGLLDSLRRDVGRLAVRVVVVDNDSSDDTVDVVRGHRDVHLYSAGGNLGYAAAINIGQHLVGDTDEVLVLNPDVVVPPGMIAALRAALRAGGAVAAVPRIEQPDGRTFDSLRREPSIARALGDALWLYRLPGLSRLSETVRDATSYREPHPVDWATGAVLLTTAACARAVGDWDERFFLYSEETDYARRIRAAHGRIVYAPDAVAMHRAGGSGGPAALSSLMAVNRIRYFEKHHRRPASSLFRMVVVLHHAVRFGRSAAHRQAARTVVRRASWTALPRGSR